MKKILLISFLSIITGCSTTVPVAKKFPDAPAVLFEKCPDLQTIDKHENVSITELVKNVTVNYTAYYECNVKLENWIEWYNGQKKIWESIK